MRPRYRAAPAEFGVEVEHAEERGGVLFGVAPREAVEVDESQRRPVVEPLIGAGRAVCRNGGPGHEAGVEDVEAGEDIRQVVTQLWDPADDLGGGALGAGPWFGSGRPVPGFDRRDGERAERDPDALGDGFTSRVVSAGPIGSPATTPCHSALLSASQWSGSATRKGSHPAARAAQRREQTACR